MKPNPDAVTNAAEQLLDNKSQRPKEHVLKSPKKPGVKQKNEAATQRKAIERDVDK